MGLVGVPENATVPLVGIVAGVQLLPCPQVPLPLMFQSPNSRR